MKLSEKGFSKLWETFSRKTGIELYPSEIDAFEEAIANHEFEPDDFDGYFQNGKDHVVLTVDEVFTLKQMVQWVMKSSKLNNMNKVFLEKTYNFLNERFEKAEKGNETE